LGKLSWTAKKSNWDRLPLELQDYIEEMPARRIHHERLEKVRHELLFHFHIEEGLREYWERHDPETGCYF